jgi:hypothetical protein
MVDIHNHLSKLEAEIAVARVALDPDKFENLSDYLAVANHLDMAFLLTGEIAGALLPMHDTEVVVQLHAGPKATCKEAFEALDAVYSQAADTLPAEPSGEDGDEDLDEECVTCEHFSACAGLTE